MSIVATTGGYSDDDDPMYESPVEHEIRPLRHHRELKPMIRDQIRYETESAVNALIDQAVYASMRESFVE